MKEKVKLYINGEFDSIQSMKIEKTLIYKGKAYSIEKIVSQKDEEIRHVFLEELIHTNETIEIRFKNLESKIQQLESELKKRDMPWIL